MTPIAQPALLRGCYRPGQSHLRGRWPVSAARPRCIPVRDARRIEVVCNGSPLWHGAQLAVDATVVSPVTRAGEARANADARPGLALDQAAQRKRRHIYPELEGARRCRLVVFGVEIGGRWSREAAQFVRLLARARAAAAPAAPRGGKAGFTGSGVVVGI